MRKFIFILISLWIALPSVGQEGGQSVSSLNALKQMSDSIGKQFVPDRRVGVYDVGYRLINYETVVAKGLITSPAA